MTIPTGYFGPKGSCGSPIQCLTHIEKLICDARETKSTAEIEKDVCIAVKETALNLLEETFLTRTHSKICCISSFCSNIVFQIELQSQSQFSDNRLHANLKIGRYDWTERSKADGERVQLANGFTEAQIKHLAIKAQKESQGNLTMLVDDPASTTTTLVQLVREAADRVYMPNPIRSMFQKQDIIDAEPASVREPVPAPRQQSRVRKRPAEYSAYEQPKKRPHVKLVLEKRGMFQEPEDAGLSLSDKIRKYAALTNSLVGQAEEAETLQRSHKLKDKEVEQFRGELQEARHQLEEARKDIEQKDRQLREEQSDNNESTKRLKATSDEREKELEALKHRFLERMMAKNEELKNLKKSSERRNNGTLK